MTKSTPTYLAYFTQAKTHLRRAFCSALGHQRSRLAAKQIDDIWHSYCERCECLLRRGSPRRWHEISPEDYANASKLASETWSAMHSVAKGGAQATPAPDGRSTKPSADMCRSPLSGYNVNYFARKHGLTPERSRKIIDRVGGDRGELNAAAHRFKKQLRRTS